MDPVTFTQAGPRELQSLWNGAVQDSAASTGPSHTSPIFDTPFVESTVFQLGNQVIEDNGGIMDPSAIIRSQVQMLTAEMSWIFTAQLANKASSGIQTLFNNQV